MARSRRFGGRSQQNRQQNNYNQHQYSPRQKQNALKNIERYLNMAKDAAANGDVHQAENYYQHADHYHRIAHANDDYRQHRNYDDATVEDGEEEEPQAATPSRSRQPYSVSAPQPEIPVDYKPVTEKPVVHRKPAAEVTEKISTDPSVAAEKPKRKYTRRKKASDNVTDNNDKPA